MDDLKGVFTTTTSKGIIGSLIRNRDGGSGIEVTRWRTTDCKSGIPAAFCCSYVCPTSVLIEGDDFCSIRVSYDDTKLVSLDCVASGVCDVECI